jgi:hypothetical protein
VVRSLALSIAASLGVGSSEAVARVPAVPSTTLVEADCITPLDVPVGRGKLFLFPPVLEVASTFTGLAKRSFGSKTTPRREAIQLYKTTPRSFGFNCLFNLFWGQRLGLGLLGGLGGVCLG